MANRMFLVGLVLYRGIAFIVVRVQTLYVGVQIKVAVGEAEGSLERGAQNGDCHAQ